MDSRKELEDMVDNLMQDDGLQAPSIDFTQKVVGKAIANTPLLDTRYQSLLPKWSWYLLLLGALGLVLFGLQQYALTGNTPGYGQYLQVFGNWFSAFVAKLRFSKMLLYVAVVAGGLVCLQTFVLKRYWDSRLP